MMTIICWCRTWENSGTLCKIVFYYLLTSSLCRDFRNNGASLSPPLSSGPTTSPILSSGPTTNPTLSFGPTTSPTLSYGPTLDQTLSAGPTTSPTLAVVAALAAYRDASNGIPRDNGYSFPCALHSSKVAAAFFFV